MLRQQNRDPDLRQIRERQEIRKELDKAKAAFWLAWGRCARLFSALPRDLCECRSVELRALCNEVPRTPPGPEGSNGTGITSGAADHPEFLSLKNCGPRSSGKTVRVQLTSSLPCLLKTEN